MPGGGLELLPALRIHATNSYREGNIWIKGVTDSLFICQNAQALKVDLAGLDWAWLNFSKGPFLNYVPLLK